MKENVTAARSAERLVRWMTAAAWTALLVGVVLSLAFIQPFNTENAPLMAGLGFMVGSVHIYVIRTAIHLVHARSAYSNENREQA